MTPLRVGIVEYVITVPLLAGLEHIPDTDRIEWHQAPPTTLNKMLVDGDIDVSLVSTAAYLANTEQLQLLRSVCIAAYEKVLSVCLYTKVPLWQLGEVTIAVTDHSASSAALLKLLCQRCWNVSPTFHIVSTLDECLSHDAFLIIGDVSLENPEVPGYNTVDLAQAWCYATGLPFCFAVLVARAEVAKQRPHEVAALERALLASVAWSEGHADAVVSTAASRCNVSRERLAEYYTRLNYRFDDSIASAIDTFDSMINPPTPCQTTP